MFVGKTLEPKTELRMCLYDKQIMTGLRIFPHQIVARNILIISLPLKWCFPAGRRGLGACFLLIKSDADVNFFHLSSSIIYTSPSRDVSFPSEVLDGYDSAVFQRKHRSCD